MARTDLKLDQFRARLLKERAKYTGDAERAGSIFNDSELDETGELTAHDDHQADIASDLTEREQRVLLRDNLRDIVRQIDLALEKLDRGTYGLCDICGKEIPKARLDFEPYALHCVEDQERLEGTA